MADKEVQWGAEVEKYCMSKMGRVGEGAEEEGGATDNKGIHTWCQAAGRNNTDVAAWLQFCFGESCVGFSVVSSLVQLLKHEREPILKGRGKKDKKEKASL